MQPSESCVTTCTLNQRPVYEVTTAEAFRCFNKPQKVNCSWGPRKNRKRQEKVIAAVCLFCLNWEKKPACNEFLSLRFFITKTEAYLLTTVLPWNDMCGERFGFAPQCFHLEGQSRRCQTQANQITPCCWNTVKCPHTWQALSKDASPSLTAAKILSLLSFSFTFFIWRGMKINSQIETLRISVPAKSRKAQDTFLLAPESLGSNKLFLFDLLCNTHSFN